jgi:hypothetical protein
VQAHAHDQKPNRLWYVQINESTVGFPDSTVVLTSSGWKSPELLVVGDVVYVETDAGGNKPVPVTSLETHDASAQDVQARLNRVFIAAVLQREREAETGPAPKARSPRASTGVEALLPADLTAEAIAQLSRHTHHGYDLHYGGQPMVKRSTKKGMALWGKSLKLGVTTPAMIGGYGIRS